METLHSAKEFGFTFDNLTVDFGAAVKRSRGIVGRQTKGVGFLMKKNKIDVINGQGGFTDAHTLQVTPFGPESADAPARKVTAANFIIAVGASARSLPGTKIDGERVIQYRDAIVMDTVPEKIIVIGAGAIGMEFSFVWNAYGADVTVIEMLDQVLPLEDSEVAAEVAKAFKKSGVNLLTSHRTEKVDVGADGVTVTVDAPTGGTAMTQPEATTHALAPPWASWRSPWAWAWRPLWAWAEQAWRTWRACVPWPALYTPPRHTPARRRRAPRYSSGPPSASLPAERYSRRIARRRCSWLSGSASAAARNAARTVQLRTEPPVNS